MKKLLTCLLIMVLVMISANSEENNTVTVIVTKGSNILCFADVDVDDTDHDGILTINDALYLAHSLHCEAGADGYLSYKSDYGLSLGLLWGVDNGGAYSYYINNESPMDLSDPIKGGDVIHAFLFDDLVTWSDLYSWFEETEITCEEGETMTLTLCSMGYDEAWNVVIAPVNGAILTVNGEETQDVSNEDGVFTFTAPAAGEYVLSAVMTDIVLCAPACRLIVK